MVSIKIKELAKRGTPPLDATTLLLEGTLYKLLFWSKDFEKFLTSLFVFSFVLYDESYVFTKEGWKQTKELTTEDYLVDIGGWSEKRIEATKNKLLPKLNPIKNIWMEE